MFGLTSFAQSSFASLGGNTYLKSLTESVSASDYYSGPIVIPVAVSESAAVDTTVYSIQSLAVAIQESQIVADAYANTMIALASLSESASVTDLLQQLTGKFVYITETAAISDAISAAGSTYSVSQNESENIQAFDSTGNIITANVTENAVTAAASQTAQLVLNPSIQESITVSDVYASIAQFVAFINETAPANAYQAANIVAYVNISEASTPADDQNAGNQINVLITESTTPAANLATVFNYVVDIAEASIVADNITYTVDAKGIVTGVLLTISLSSPLVWEQINDDQSPNWVEIKD